MHWFFSKDRLTPTALSMDAAAAGGASSAGAAVRSQLSVPVPLAEPIVSGERVGNGLVMLGGDLSESQHSQAVVSPLNILGGAILCCVLFAVLG